MQIFDDDTVELHNLPNQFFRKKDIGRSKVEALADIVKEFTDFDIKINNKRYEDENLSGIVISAVDSMKSRQAIFDMVRTQSEVELYIDSRMGGEVAQIFTLRPSDQLDVEEYEKTLFNDDEAEELPCTAQAIIYTVLGIAQPIARLVKKFLMGGLEESDKRLMVDFFNQQMVKEFVV